MAMTNKVYIVYRNRTKLLETKDIDFAQYIAKCIHDYDCNFSSDPYHYVSVMEMKREITSKTVCKWGGYNGN